MKSDEITWQIVTNTVGSRMIDLSLIHTLVPCRRLRRRTKAMNAEIKNSHSLKTYSQYVKMKTSVLRHLSDDSETDDNVSFTEDDYSILYKSNMSVTNYMQQMSAKSTRNSHEQFDGINRNNVQPSVNKKRKTKNAKSKSFKDMNVGWQEVIKKKKKESTSLSLDNTNRNKRIRTRSICSPRDSVRKHTQHNLNVSNDLGSAPNWSGGDSLNQGNEVSRSNEASITEKIVESRLKTMDSDRIMHNIITGQEVRSNESRLMEQKSPAMDEISERSQSEEIHNCKSFGSKKTPKSIKKNLKSLLNNENIAQDIEEPCTSTEVPLDQNHVDCSDKSSKIESISVNGNKGNCPEIQPSPDGCINLQPKDSGIDEDTEEEFSEDGKRIPKRVKVQPQEAHQSTQITSTVSDHENNSVGETCLSTFNTNSSDNNDDSDKIDTEDMIPSPIENVNSTEDKVDIEDMTPSLVQSMGNIEDEVDTEDMTPSPVENVNSTEDKVDIEDMTPSLVQSMDNIEDEVDTEDMIPSPVENVNNTEDKVDIEDMTPSLVQSMDNIEDEVDTEDMAPSPVENVHNIEDEVDTEDTALSPVENLHNIKDEVDTKDMAASPVQNVDNYEEDRREDQENRVPKQKSHPKVTRTEIVKRRYRIISGDESVIMYPTDPETSTKHFSDEEVLDTVEMDQNIEDSMSPLTKKRLQQLRRLNLTVDSESSLSEDDDKPCNVENMRNKLLKRSDDSSNMSSSEDENVDFKPVIVQLPKKLKNDNRSKMEKHRKKTISYPVTMHGENEQMSDSETSMQSLKYTEFNKSSHKRMLKSPSKKELNRITPHDLSRSEDCLKEAISNPSKEHNSKSSHLGCIENSNFNQSTDKKKLSGRNLEDESIVEAVTKNKGRRSRPCNLQEFIDEENLIHETATPSFTFKDIQDEDDIFLLDIPSTVLQSKLVGKTIVLTEKKLKLGKKKYKITYNDADRVSCVFGTGKSRKPYKTVNIKPMARVVARQKIFNSSFEKSSDRYMSDTMSCADDTNEIKNHVIPTKKRLDKKRSHSLKRK